MLISGRLRLMKEFHRPAEAHADTFRSRCNFVVFSRGKRKGSSFAELEGIDPEEGFFPCGFEKNVICIKACT